MGYILDLKIGDLVYDEMIYPGVALQIKDIEGFFIVISDPHDGRDRIYCWSINEETGDIDFPEHLSKTPYQIIGRTSCYIKL